MILQHQLKVSINTTSWLFASRISLRGFSLRSNSQAQFHVVIKKQIIHT